MIELLPCPFCGGEAKVCRSVYGSWFVRCANDYKNMANPGCYVSPTTTAKDTEAEAIAAWNTRAERTCEIEHVKGGAMYDVWRCSACGYEYAESVSETSVVQNYCPNCGAKVVGE